MNKNLAISLTALSALALSACSDNTDEKSVPVENSNLQGTLIDVQLIGTGLYGKNRMWYLIDTDNNPLTAEYTGFLDNAAHAEDVLEAFNDKQAKPIMTIAQWNKKLKGLTKVSAKTKE